MGLIQTCARRAFNPQWPQRVSGCPNTLGISQKKAKVGSQFDMALLALTLPLLGHTATQARNPNSLSRRLLAAMVLHTSRHLYTFQYNSCGV